MNNISSMSHICDNYLNFLILYKINVTITKFFNSFYILTAVNENLNK